MVTVIHHIKCLTLPDKITNDEKHSYIETTLFATYTILCAIGIVFACVMLTFNLWYKEQP